MFRCSCFRVVLHVMAILAAATAVAQEQAKDERPAPEPKSEVKAKIEKPVPLTAWQKLFRQHASEYKVAISGDDDAEIGVLNEPIFRWSQPVRGGDDGEVFLWVSKGRPVIVGTLLSFPLNGKHYVMHELHSLSQKPLVATRKERTWKPTKDVIAWTPIGKDSGPADSAKERLRQMEELSRNFQAESVNREERVWQLRRLPQPIYRYALPDKDRKDGLLDGALFGFVDGADLEVVLLLQARKTDDGAQWEYALARMSDFRLKVTLEGKSVWEVDRYPNDPESAYYAPIVERRVSAEVE